MHFTTEKDLTHEKSQSLAKDSSLNETGRH